MLNTVKKTIKAILIILALLITFLEFLSSFCVSSFSFISLFAAGKIFVEKSFVTTNLSEVLATAASNSSLSFLALSYLFWGSFSIAFITTCSNSSGIEGFILNGLSGSSCTCFNATAIGVSPVNGNFPVSIS